MFSNIYAGRRVLITGHTGFKGTWLASWLLQLGAEVGGLSNGLPSQPSNFEVLGLQNRLKHYPGDVTDAARVAEVLADFKPEIVFHLAAQALVRRSYRDPAGTFATNAMGSLHVLEGVRRTPSVRALVMITSDKCYRNVEWIWGYRENDMLGGDDPYSASKACAELISHSYIKSFFQPAEGVAAVATARAGNVIGGGDWAEDRIVPDCVRSWSAGQAVQIRNPNATRPWQHVLEPLSGYLQLGAALWERQGKVLGQAYNFGPDSTVNHPVSKLIEALAGYWQDAKWVYGQPAGAQQHEATLLKLCCDKALADLAWRPTLTFAGTVQFTGEWYRHYCTGGGAGLYALTQKQIGEYCRQAEQGGLAWTR